VVEGVSSNVTLVCDVSGKYDSIVWFYNGDFLRQIPDPECDDDIDHDDEFSGDDSHELSSEGVDLLSEEGFSDFIEDRLSKRSADLEANIDEGSGDSSYDVIEELLSMSGDYLTDDSESLLCGVDPSMLTLQDVSRHFSGHYSCAGVRGDHTPGPVSQPLHLHVQYAPKESFVSAAEIIMREDESFPAVFCDGEADPDPEVSWWFNNALISQENTLDFSDPITREEAGSYECHIANIHGVEIVTVDLKILHKPYCNIRHQLRDEELILTCSVEANPKVILFDIKNS